MIILNPKSVVSPSRTCRTSRTGPTGPTRPTGANERFGLIQRYNSTLSTQGILLPIFRSSQIEQSTVERNVKNAQM